MVWSPIQKKSGEHVTGCAADGDGVYSMVVGYGGVVVCTRGVVGTGHRVHGYCHTGYTGPAILVPDRP